jgi:hypothetical protein
MAKAARPEGGLLAVRVQPGAARDGIAGWHGAALKVRVAAPPEDGRANRAVTALLARALRVPPSALEIVRGASRRDKLVRVAGLGLAEIRARLPETFPHPSPAPPTGAGRVRGSGPGEGPV